MKNSRSIAEINSVTMENMSNMHDSKWKPYCGIVIQHLRLTLSQKRAGTQRRTMVDDNGRCIVHTVVGEKACLGTKRHPTIKK